MIVYTSIRAQKDLADRPVTNPLSELFFSAVAECAIWAALTFAILWLARRFPLGHGRWLKSLAVHSGACLACALIATVLSAIAAELIRVELPRISISINVLVLFFVAKLNNNIFFYVVILIIAHVVNYYRQLRQRELFASQLEAKLAQTQLQVLKMQLQPHFLFNTLNAISALIHQDVELADRMIARLGDLLRTTLDSANKQEVALRQELDFIGPYLEIEKARLGQRLTVTIAVDAEVMDALVPNLVLQPLVENAIRHGIAVGREPGTVRIRAWRENGRLRITIADSGPGIHMPMDALKGIGLANTRARLQALYGADHAFDLTDGPEGGLLVSITIPFTEAPAGSESGDVPTNGDDFRPRPSAKLAKAEAP